MQFSLDPFNTLETLSAKNKTKSLSIYIIVVLVLIGFVCCLPIIKVDVSGQSRGMVRAIDNNIPISSVVSGKLSYVNAKNNQNITKGDTLYIITTDNLEAQIKNNDSLLELRLAELQDYEHLLSKQYYKLQVPNIKEQYLSFKARQQELQSRVSQLQITYNRYNTLYQKEVIARAEYETHLYNLRFARQALQQLNTQQQSEWENQKLQLEERINNLKIRGVELVFEEDKYVVIAPTTGTLENVVGLQPNAFVNATQVLASISPKGQLIVENTVSLSDIGLIQKGQTVNFQIDAFNYNQWGMLQGEVTDIDQNITLQENAAFFKVRCSLYTKTLRLKNGYEANIKKGMTLTSRYYITRRSLYELLFDKVDDWFNPKVISTQ